MLARSLSFHDRYPSSRDSTAAGAASEASFQPAVNSRLAQSARRGSIIAALLVGALAFIALLGWILHTKPLPFPSAIISINPINACGWMMASISLLLLPRNRLSANPLRLGEVMAFAVVMMGALKLFSVLFHWNTDLDTWFFTPDLGEAFNPVRRFAPKMAVAFILIGGGLLLSQHERAYRYSQLLCFFTIATGVLCLQGYAFGLLKYHNGPHLVLISAASGLAVMLLGIGILLAQTERGAMGLIFSDTAGGLLARRLLPCAVVLPLMLGLLRLAGETAGWDDARFGVALFTTMFVFILVTVVWLTARRLHWLDLKQRAAEWTTHKSEDRVRLLNIELEQRVAERTAAFERASVANHDLESFCTPFPMTCAPH